MFSVEEYSEQYHDDIVQIVKNFHEEAVHEYDPSFDPDVVAKTIARQKDMNNAFLLIVDGKCQGLIAGAEIEQIFGTTRIYQEQIWYVNKEFRRYGIFLLRTVERILQSRGVTIILMGVLENSKTGKIKQFYEMIGYKLFQSSYIKKI
jgi:hypothetical protein